VGVTFSSTAGTLSATTAIDGRQWPAPRDSRNQPGGDGDCASRFFFRHCRRPR
jgi:hypothetical protein